MHSKKERNKRNFDQPQAIVYIVKQVVTASVRVRESLNKEFIRKRKEQSSIRAINDPITYPRNYAQKESQKQD